MSKSLFLLLLFIVISFGCADSHKKDDKREHTQSNDKAKAEAVKWLYKKTSLRDLDNHHIEHHTMNEPTYEEWFNEGRRIRSISSLLTELLEKKSTQVDLSHVAFDLGYLGNKESISVLIESLESDDIYLRYQAVIALGNLGDKRAIPILCRAVENDESSNVRANALISLGNFDTPEVRACIKSAFDDPDEFVSEVAHEMYEKFKME